MILRDKVTRQCPQTTTFEEKGEPKRIRTEVTLLTSLTPYREAKPAHSTGALKSRPDIAVLIDWASNTTLLTGFKSMFGRCWDFRSSCKDSRNIPFDYGVAMRETVIGVST